MAIPMFSWTKNHMRTLISSFSGRHFRFQDGYYFKTIFFHIFQIVADFIFFMCHWIVDVILWSWTFISTYHNIEDIKENRHFLSENELYWCLLHMSIQCSPMLSLLNEQLSGIWLFLFFSVSWSKLLYKTSAHLIHHLDITLGCVYQLHSLS